MTKLSKLSLFFVILGVSVACSDDTPAFDPVKQLAADISEIDNYLASNSITAYKFNTGIRIRIISLGEGLPPKVEHTVKVKYTGRIMKTGAVFESNTVDRLISEAIDGWQLALPLLPIGTKAEIFIPSGFGYGNEGTSSVPSNANLIYEVELLESVKPTSEVQQLASDIAAIDSYLADHSIVAEEDASGIRYVVHEAGSATKPGLYSKVIVRYTGKKLASGIEFFTGTLQPTTTFDSYVVNYLLGLQVGFQKLGKGGKATIYIPSPLGFGNVSIANGAVPANSNLIYEVEVLDIL